MLLKNRFSPQKKVPPQRARTYESKIKEVSTTFRFLEILSAKVNIFSQSERRRFIIDDFFDLKF
jgi:hypothetical protein